MTEENNKPPSKDVPTLSATIRTPSQEFLKKLLSGFVASEFHMVGMHKVNAATTVGIGNAQQVETEAMKLLHEIQHNIGSLEGVTFVGVGDAEIAMASGLLPAPTTPSNTSKSSKSDKSSTLT
jgi:hypothetical protein